MVRYLQLQTEAGSQWKALIILYRMKANKKAIDNTKGKQQKIEEKSKKEASIKHKGIFDILFYLC